MKRLVRKAIAYAGRLTKGYPVTVYVPNSAAMLKCSVREFRVGGSAGWVVLVADRKAWVSGND